MKIEPQPGQDLSRCLFLLRILGWLALFAICWNGVVEYCRSLAERRQPRTEAVAHNVTNNASSTPGMAHSP